MVPPVCAITEISSPCFDPQPCLLREYKAPVSLQHAMCFLKHLSLGKFPSASQVLCVLYGTLLELFVGFHKKTNHSWACQKWERQPRCDNPRVKGVNMRREFHAWQVCRMAPVFSLFTHANEQYADEQTWAQPRLPATQNWLDACLCCCVSSSRIPLVCCSLMAFKEFVFLCKHDFCVLSEDYTWCFWQQLKHRKQFLFQSVHSEVPLKWYFDSILLPKFHISCFKDNIALNLNVVKNIHWLKLMEY